MTRDATEALEILMENFKIESISEEGARIYYGTYLLYRLKWMIEFLSIALVFCCTGAYLWIHLPVNVALKLVFEFGILNVLNYILTGSADKKATEFTKSFIKFVNRDPQYFTFYEEDTEDGTEGNAKN